MGYGGCRAPSHANRAKGDAVPSPPTQTLPAGDGAGHLWHPSVSLYTVGDEALSEGGRLLLHFPFPSTGTNSYHWQHGTVDDCGS